MISVWGSSHWIFCQKCIFPLWISVCLHVLQVKFWVFFLHIIDICVSILISYLIFWYFSLWVFVYKHGCILSVILCILLPRDFATELYRFPSNKIASTSVLTTKEQENVCTIKHNIFDKKFSQYLIHTYWYHIIKVFENCLVRKKVLLHIRPI